MYVPLSYVNFFPYLCIRKVAIIIINNIKQRFTNLNYYYYDESRY